MSSRLKIRLVISTQSSFTEQKRIISQTDDDLFIHNFNKVTNWMRYFIFLCLLMNMTPVTDVNRKPLFCIVSTLLNDKH